MSCPLPGSALPVPGMAAPAPHDSGPSLTHGVTWLGWTESVFLTVAHCVSQSQGHLGNGAETNVYYCVPYNNMHNFQSFKSLRNGKYYGFAGVSKSSCNQTKIFLKLEDLLAQSVLDHEKWQSN